MSQAAEAGGLTSYRAVVRVPGGELTLDFAAGGEHAAHLAIPTMVAALAPGAAGYELVSLLSDPDATWHHT
ncbi:MAG TPA: hypothetical protein VNT60_10715, partial [Deinococcales bacterium]|nr:hypothetical protein [Deinococcales bacterium]